MCRVLVKKGEDIYHESAIQILFRMMNEIWGSTLPSELLPLVCSFRELPASPSLGFLQIIEGCKDLEEIELGDFAQIQDPENFIRTTCGWCLASYILGLSDRHRENTMVRIADSSAIPIDFGFMLGQTAPSVNAYMITISNQMYQYLQRLGAWPQFGTMFLAGFWALRQKAEVLMSAAALLFEGHRDPAFVRKFIAHRLLMSEATSLLAVKRAYKRLRHAPVCSDTRSKIDNHAKNKRFLAEHGGNFMVRFVIRRSLEAPPELKTGRHIHMSKVKLPLLSTLPEGAPPLLQDIIHAIHAPPASPRSSSACSISTSILNFTRLPSLLRYARKNAQTQEANETMPIFVSTEKFPSDDQASSSPRNQ